MNKSFGLFFVLAVSVFLFSFAIAEPNGATVGEAGDGDSTASASAAGSNDAIAGNVTELSITGVSITQAWQGYYGNVSGSIQLADGSSNVLYNWSLASPQGEIYSSTNGSGINWDYIQCFNMTANGTYQGDLGAGGTTSQGGTNYTQLEDEFNIGRSDVDGVNETFSLDGSHEQGYSLTHDEFFTNSYQFSAGECPSTHMFDSSDNVTDNTFQEVLLYEPSSSSVIFTAILNEDAVGFDDDPHDFEMLVLEDGHSGDTSTTSYFFYVEIE